MRMIDRAEALEIVRIGLLDEICPLYGIEKERLSLHPEYEGCQNLIYYYDRNGAEYVLRISFREDRSWDEIRAEAHFVSYLHAGSASVSNPVKSRNGNFVEKLSASGKDFYAVVFNKAPGKRLPDNNYKYRDGVSIDEYYRNFGKTLGKMHRLAKGYSPPDPAAVRPAWLANMRDRLIPAYIPRERAGVIRRFRSLCDEADSLPKDRDSYGLIHADFGDGNFTIDYQTGTITVFDFDDCAYCLFMYDLADAWTKGVGWAMFEPSVDKRKEKMEDWFGKVLSGYRSENAMSDHWLERLPFFIKLVEMEGVVDGYRHGDEDEELLYALKCVEEDIPYLGFFDPLYSPEHPFCLS
jgi:Ser/Thr protein kinase RdoA (MazF antagonist)